MHKASLFRRLGALLYDTLVSIALLMLTTACWLPVYGGNAVPPGQIVYQASLVLVLYAYFAHCWRQGQTVGMRAWRLVILSQDGSAVAWKQTVVRFFLAPVGIVLQCVGWPVHERWSGTVVCVKDPHPNPLPHAGEGS